MPERIGKYELQRILGKGGMGEVWKARDTELNRIVALKLLQRTSKEDLARFRREAHSVARLSHPNIAQLYEFNEEPPFIAMQFIQGVTINLVPSAQHVPALRDTALALQHAHDHKILHRDLKPANLLVDESGRAFILDFGIAREVSGSETTSVTMSGDIVGTPAFMAPEQARGESTKLDEQTDVYGLGATLYALLSGRPPFEGKGTFETLRMVVQDEPPPPGGDPDLQLICMKAMEKQAHRRYPTARAFADDLTRFLESRPVSARPPSLGYRIRKRIQRQPVVWALSAVLFLSIIAGTVFGFRQLGGRLASEQEARRRQDELMEALRKREYLERMTLRISELKTQLTFHQEDARLKLLEEELRRVTKELAAEAAVSRDAGWLWYLSGEARRLLYETREAIEDYGRALSSPGTEWSKARDLKSRAAMGRALARAELIQDSVIHGAGTDFWTLTEESRRQVELMKEDVAAIGSDSTALGVLAQAWKAFLERRFSDLEELVRAEINRGGANGDLCFVRGLNRMETGRGEDASKDLGIALDKFRGNARAWFFRGSLYSNMKMWKESILHYNEAIRLRPHHVPALINRANAWSWLEEFDRALEDYERALEIGRDIPEVYTNRARVHVNRSNFDEAMEDVRAAVRLRPEDPDAQYIHGYILFKKGQFRDSIEKMNRVLKSRPDHAAALETRGGAWLRLGKRETAIQDFSAAIRLTPKLASLWKSRGTAHAQLNRFAESIPDFDEAIRRDPKDPDNWKNRGLALARLNRLKDALPDLKRFLALAPRHRDAAQVRQLIRQLERRIGE